MLTIVPHPLNTDLASLWAPIPNIIHAMFDPATHLLFTLLLVQTLGLEPELVLMIVFLLHSVSMLVPYKMSALIRAQTKSATAVGLVNVALVAAWLVPIMTLPVATAFIVTYLYSFVVKGQQWLRQRHQ